jgi:secernin
LRDHYEDTFLAGPYFTAGLPDLLTLCMHDSPAGFTWGNTAGSAVFRLPAEPARLPHLWWAAGTPCTSVYIPVFPAAGRVPPAVGLPAAPETLCRPEDAAPAAFDGRSYWWRFHELLGQVKGGELAWTFNERQPRVRQVFDALERQWQERLPEVERNAVRLLAAHDEAGRDVLARFTESCAHEALDACARLIEEFQPR